MPVSLGQLASNRANAKLSTGPKSVAGRMRSSQNARRHGLNVPVLADRNLSVEVTRLAAEIAGFTNDPTIRTASQRVALALVELERIESIEHAIASQCCEEGKAALNLGNLSILYQRLDRYKKRALAKRRTAIKGLALAKQGSTYSKLTKRSQESRIESTLG